MVRQSSTCTGGFSLMESRSSSHTKHQLAARHLSFPLLGAVYVNASLCSSIHVMPLLLPSQGQLNRRWRASLVFIILTALCPPLGFRVP